MEHADLDNLIDQAALMLPNDELSIRRLKKRRLLLRDQIAQLEAELRRIVSPTGPLDFATREGFLMSELSPTPRTAAFARGGRGLAVAHWPWPTRTTSSARCSCAWRSAWPGRSTIAARSWRRRARASARHLHTWCPHLLSGARALVSTATKSLQDQLFLRDIPRLREALQLPVSVALLKGRGSYLCLHRMNQARQAETLPDRWAVRTLAKVEQWSHVHSERRSGRARRAGRTQQRDPARHLLARQLPWARIARSSANVMW